MIDVRPLTDVPYESLAAAFNEAFSDYSVPAAYTAEAIRSLLTRRGYRADVAVGAFDGERLVGFVFNCLDGDSAYNSGTGVVPSHRRGGIARRLMERSLETLPARRYVLEVIEDNVRAADLYRLLGMQERRRLQCWAFTPRQPAKITELANADLDAIYGRADVEPSWQNSAASIRRAVDPRVVLGNEEGAAVLFPWTGDLPLLAVARDARRKGLGSRLLEACATRANRPLRIVNVDDRDRGIEAFLERAGAVKTVRQIEMEIRL